VSYTLHAVKLNQFEVYRLDKLINYSGNFRGKASP